MDVVDVGAFFGGAQAHGVGGADDLSAFDSAAREPHRKAMRIMIAAVAAFAHRHASEFAAPDDQGGVEQAAGFEVFQQGGHRLVALGAKLGVIAVYIAMAVPAVGVAAVELHEADAAFDHAAGEEAAQAEFGGGFVVEAVEGFGVGGFLADVDDFGGVGRPTAGHGRSSAGCGVMWTIAQLSPQHLPEPLRFPKRLDGA